MMMTLASTQVLAYSIYLFESRKQESINGEGGLASRLPLEVKMFYTNIESGKELYIWNVHLSWAHFHISKYAPARKYVSKTIIYV